MLLTAQSEALGCFSAMAKKRLTEHEDADALLACGGGGGQPEPDTGDGRPAPEAGDIDNSDS